MPAQHIELPIVNRITIGTVGEPGRRMFLLQASDALDTITLKLEKEQARALAHKSQELLDSLDEEYPVTHSSMEIMPSPADLLLQNPLEPLFAIGQIGLGYDKMQDRIVLAIQELVVDENQEPSTAQFWITRSQLGAMSNHALSIIEQGRATCPLCGQPMDPTSHFCPRRNGHDKLPT